MVRLGDVVRIEASSKQVTGERFWLLNLDMVEQQTGNVIAYNYVDKDALNGSIIQFDTNCVLYSKLRPNLNKVVLPNQDGFATSEMLPLRPDTKVLTKEYLTAFLRSESFVTWAVSKTAGAKMPRLGSKELLGKEIPLPSISEQTRIAGQFAKVDELITLRKEQLAKLDQLVKSRFIELFGDPFNNKKWDTQKLRNISVSISDGSNVDKTYYEDKGDVLFLRIQNVWFNEFRLDDSVYISEDVNNEYLDTSLHHGDLLITKIGRYYTKDSSLGRVSVYLGEDDKANYSNNIMRVRLTDEVCSEFVNILMNLDDYNRYIREVSVGGTDKRALSQAIIGDLPIIMPPKELQFEFLEFVRQTDKSKLAIQQSLDKLETLKKSLMQEYFG